MQKICNYIGKNRWIIIFLIIFSIGIFLRTVNFEDLLIIKSDQARDALIMNNAEKGGFFSLPLLGPQVGGTEFRLGPISYYFQYFSGKIFDFGAESVAYPDLIFGILTIPFIFLVFRRFFSDNFSLWFTSLASFSLLLVTFSRFAWNPNSLPFFSALFLWSFLEGLNSERKKRWIFLGIAASAIGIMAQLHLTAVLGLGLGLMLFLAFSRSLNWKEVFIGLAIILFFHAPVLVNEWNTGGENVEKMLRSATSKVSDQKHSVLEKGFRSFQENSRISWLILAGQENTDMISTKGSEIRCDKKCKAALPYSLTAMFIFVAMLVSYFLSWRREGNEARKNEKLFIGLWLVGFLLFSVPLAYQMETRFYLGIFIPFLIALGFLVERIYVYANKNRWSRIAFLVLGVSVLFLNFYSTSSYLYELHKSQFSSEESKRDLRFGTAPKVTLGQLREIGLEAERLFDNNAPVIITGESLYLKAMYYVISSENKRVGCYTRENEEISSQFNHLIIQYAPDENAPIEFGTLAANFIPAVGGYSSSEEFSIPKKCLDY